MRRWHAGTGAALLAVSLLAAFLLAAPGPASAAAVVSGWEETEDQAACVESASRAVGSVGFRVSASGDRQTVFGFRGEDSIAVRCIGDRRVAAFFLSLIGTGRGPSASATMSALRASFRGEAAPAPAVPAPGGAPAGGSGPKR